MLQNNELRLLCRPFRVERESLLSVKPVAVKCGNDLVLLRFTASASSDLLVVKDIFLLSLSRSSKFGTLLNCFGFN